MSQIKNKLTDKNNNAEFDTEIEYQDSNRPNSKPSEPARKSGRPSAINKEKISEAGAVKKNV